MLGKQLLGYLVLTCTLTAMQARAIQIRIEAFILKMLNEFLEENCDLDLELVSY